MAMPPRLKFFVYRCALQVQRADRYIYFTTAFYVSCCWNKNPVNE